MLRRHARRRRDAAADVLHALRACCRAQPGRRRRPASPRNALVGSGSAAPTDADLSRHHHNAAANNDRTSTALNALQAGIVGLPNVGKVKSWRHRQRGDEAGLARQTRCLLKPQQHTQRNTQRNNTTPPRQQNDAQSTLFNAIVENGKAAAANFPFCTIEPNVGIVTVPDARLAQLSKISGSKEIVRAS